ncbi:MAG: DUF3899 domain-containing protein [Firmicutes bacterium]|nr:DUF3899 domain-containing protein [Bacillota bacterium]
MNKKRAGRYAGGILLAAAVFIAGAFTQGLFREEDMQKRLGILSDCFLFPAVLLGGIGALSWAASEGTFDMLQYGFYMVFQRLLHPRKAIESFYEYKVSKEESRSGWLKHFLIVGLICLCASVVCLLLYMASGG